jgi:hypothetical protein
MTRPEAVLRKRSTTGQRRGWQHVHQLLAEHTTTPTQEVRWFRGPDDAVAAVKACAPAGCSPDCARARAAGHRSYARQEQS